jgi:tripartite ATP-independent transporter DctP family solute receptor
MGCPWRAATRAVSINKADRLEEILRFERPHNPNCVAKTPDIDDIRTSHHTARHEAEREDGMARNWTRRSLLAGAAAVGSTIIVRPSLAADYRFSQYHNQAASGTLHKNLTAMWEAVRNETNGRVETTVYAENNKLPGGDPDALKMLISGEIQFFTLMGGIIGTVVPVAEAQQLPFVFKNAAEAHKAVDGPLGRYIGQEMAAKGLHLFPVAGFDNGMRQVAAMSRPITSPDDFAGMKIRVPPGQMMLDTFAAFGAQPVTTPANKIYDSLKSGIVEAQENPLAILDGFKLYELVKYVSLTNHMWSGFNAMANLATWNALPDDIKAVIERNVTKAVRQQRLDQAALNASLREDFVKRGLVFNEVDQAAFRAKLPGVYALWKEKLGSKCWSLVEAEVGKLG